jgi:hypothetical protein
MNQLIEVIIINSEELRRIGIHGSRKRDQALDDY